MQYMVAKPTGETEHVSRHEKERPETIEDWLQQLESGEMPEELEEMYGEIT